MSVGMIITIVVLVVVAGAVVGGIWAVRQQKRLDEEGAGALEKVDKDTIDWADPDSDVQAEGNYLGTTTRVSRRTSERVPDTGRPGVAEMTVRRKDAARLITITRGQKVLLTISADAFRQVRKIISPNPRVHPRLFLGWVNDDGVRCHTTMSFPEQSDVEGLDAALWWHGSARAARDDFPEEDLR